MTVNPDLPPDIERAYLAAARAKGVSLEAFVREVLLTGQPALPATDTTPEQRAIAFEAWSGGHRSTPFLSDHAVSREAMYEGRDS